MLLLLPILLWRGEEGRTVAFVFPSLGAVLGSLVGFRKRPKLRAVAEFADARFGTADLLATALALRGSSEPWNINILKMADSRSAGISPALLTPHRLGPRAWSGILLALMAALTLGFLSFTTSLDLAQASAAPTSTDAWREWENSGTHHIESLQLTVPTAREARAETTPDSQSMPGTDAAPSNTGTMEKSSGSPREGQADLGASGGSARTNSAQVEMPRDHPGLSSDDTVANALIASGGGGLEVHNRSDGGATAGEVSSKPADRVEAWSSSNWPAARAAALNAIQDGRVPDAYRILVRDYFQNQPESTDPSLHQ